MVLEAIKVKYNSRGQLQLDEVIQSYTVTEGTRRVLDSVRFSKCIEIEYKPGIYELHSVVDPDQYFAIRGQLVNPVHKTTHDERYALSWLLKQKDCLILVR